MGTEATQIGQEVEWQVLCSALGPPGGSITSYIRYGYGIDKHMELVTLACDMGLINKGGAWYTLDFMKGEKQKLQGAEKVRQFLLDNPKVFDELYQEVKKTIGIKC